MRSSTVRYVPVPVAIAGGCLMIFSALIGASSGEQADAQDPSAAKTSLADKSAVEERRERGETVEVRFHQSYGIRKNAPVFWRSERVGQVQDIRAESGGESYIVSIALKELTDMPSQVAAVVAGVSEGKEAPGLRIELLPHPSSSVAGIVGYGSFEEFWLDLGR